MHKIRPSRIAYLMGIDIDLVEKLIAGEIHQEAFKELVSYYRKNRRTQRLQESLATKGTARVELQREIEREYRDSDAL